MKLHPFLCIDIFPKSLVERFCSCSNLLIFSSSQVPSQQMVPGGDQMNEMLCQIDVLKREKRALEKQLHTISVQGYVYQKGPSFFVGNVGGNYYRTVFLSSDICTHLSYINLFTHIRPSLVSGIVSL